LKPLGHSLTDLLDSVRVWAEGNIESVLRAQDEYDRPRIPEEDCPAPLRPASAGRAPKS
jgi:hypothetical protein